MGTIADELRREQQLREAAMPTEEKVERARVLGERALEDFAYNLGLSLRDARRELERRKQLTRRPSSVMRKLSD